MTSWLSTTETARRLSVSPKTLRRWVRANVIPHARITSRLFRFDEAEVEGGIKSKVRGAK